MRRKSSKGLRNLQRVLSILESTIQNKKFLALIDELHTNAEARAQASRHGLAYLRKRGVRLPRGARFGLKDNNWRVWACGRVLGFVGCVHYDSGKGWGWGQ
jgi:hypothetical protein